MRESDAWPDLLDVLEMCCIEIETLLINTQQTKRPQSWPTINSPKPRGWSSRNFKKKSTLKSPSTLPPYNGNPQYRS